MVLADSTLGRRSETEILIECIEDISLTIIVNYSELSDRREPDFLVGHTSNLSVLHTITTSAVACLAPALRTHLDLSDGVVLHLEDGVPQRRPDLP